MAVVRYHELSLYTTAASVDTLTPTETWAHWPSLCLELLKQPNRGKFAILVLLRMVVEYSYGRDFRPRCYPVVVGARIWPALALTVDLSAFDM